MNRAFGCHDEAVAGFGKVLQDFSLVLIRIIEDGMQVN